MGVQTLQELSNKNLESPLPEEFLKQVRTVLIQASKTGASEPSDEKTPLTPLFQTVLTTASHPPLSQPHRALACDTLSTWLIRSRASTALQSPLTASPWESMVSVVFANYDDAQSGLSKALKDLLANILSAHPKDTLGTFTESLAARVLAGIHSGSGGGGGKVSYYVLEVLLKKQVIRAEWILREYQGGSSRLIPTLLSSLQDRTLSPAIGKTLVSLLASRRQEMLKAGGTETEWMGLWQEPLRDALKSDVLRANIQIYALPGVFKTSPGCFRVFIENLGLSRYTEDPEEPTDLMSLLCSLKVGKDLGLITEQDPTTLPPTLIAPLLSHPHPHIRLSALTLLTHTPTLTLPLPPHVFTTLKTALPPLHTETDAELRNLVIGSIRTLFERIASSSYALHKDILNLQRKHVLLRTDTAKLDALGEQLEDARCFVGWYCGFLTTQLQPGANYQRVTTALRVLVVLLRSGLDQRVGGRKGVRWPWGVEVFSKAMRRVVVDNLFNPFDDVRAMAAEVLAAGEGVGRGVVERGVGRMDASGRARDADGVARVLALWGVEEGVVCGVGVREGGLAVVEWTVGLLERYLEVAREDFQKAVRERPVHGLLGGLRLILERKGVYESGEKEEWRRIHERVFRACDEIWDITKGVLCFDSPEGYMPGEEEEDEDVNTQTVMSYSWRAVKESSSLLGTILTHAPYTPPDSILTPADFSSGGALLLSQLSSIRHRGAFSAVSPSFISLCTRLFKSPDPALHTLPQTWLSENLTLIISKSNAITRRSAGLPFLIIGILISEVDPSRPLLSSSFSRLADIARQPATDTEKTDLPQVHALNCLKFLFTDSRLSSAVGEYVGVSLSLAVGCFASEVWAVRNCGIMVFTALLNRLFGARRGRNEHSAFDTRGFFERYPSVRGVLLEGLRERVGGLDGGLGGVEMVYPALSLVARLDYAQGYDVGEFEEVVGRCMGSRVWKVREMAARAYVALVGGCEGVVERLVEEVRGAGQNRVHGGLCAVRALLERRGDKEMGSVWSVLGSVWEELVVRNRCAVTKALYLQIITDYAIERGLLEGPSDALKEAVSTYCNTATEALTEITNAPIVGRSLLKEQLTRFIVSKALQSPARILETITLLSAPDEEVALSTATLLLDSEQQLELTPGEAVAFDSALWGIIQHHEWDQLRVVALKLIHRYGTSEVSLEARWRAVLDLVQTPLSEPCKDAALTALGTVTAKVWIHWQDVDGGEMWAVWCLEQLVKEVKTAAHEDCAYPSREAALEAVKALSEVLRFESLHSWQSAPEKMRGVYFALYDMLNDDDEDIRDAAAELVCRVLTERVRFTPLKAGEALAAAMTREFRGSEAFFGDVIGRLTGGVDVGVELEEVLRADTILFAREKQNLFVDCVGEVERWGGVLAELEGDGEGGRGFVYWVIAGVMVLGGKVEELGEEGALGWMGGEDVFRVGMKVIVGVGVVARWRGRGEVEDAVWERVLAAGRELLKGLESVGGHEMWRGRLGEVFQGENI